MEAGLGVEAEAAKEVGVADGGVGSGGGGAVAGEEGYGAEIVVIITLDDIAGGVGEGEDIALVVGVEVIGLAGAGHEQRAATTILIGFNGIALATHIGGRGDAVVALFDEVVAIIEEEGGDGGQAAGGNGFGDASA